MSIEERNKLDGKELELQKLAYLWYTSYQQWSEFDYEPEWADTIETRITQEDKGSYHLDVVMFRDRSISNAAWITSDKHYNLAQMT